MAIEIYISREKCLVRKVDRRSKMIEDHWSRALGSRMEIGLKNNIICDFLIIATGPVFTKKKL
jgi:hypothetical protein